MNSMAMYLSEFVGTFILILLGNGVGANVTLNTSYAKGSGWIVITTAWGFAVAIAVYTVGWIGGAHLNPAVSIALAGIGAFAWEHVAPYIIAQMLGAICGSIVTYLAFKKQFDETPEPVLGIFCTAPAVNSTVWNLVTEAIATAVLVFGILGITNGNNNVGGMGAFLVGVLIWGIGLSLGGSTGYAINPARDLGPRIAHAILPLKNKADGNWSYAWIPVVGPIIGGFLGAQLYNMFVSVTLM